MTLRGTPVFASLMPREPFCPAICCTDGAFCQTLRIGFLHSPPVRYGAGLHAKKKGAIRQDSPHCLSARKNPLAAQQFLDLRGERRDDFLPIAHYAIAGFLEDISLWVSVNGDDILGAGAPGQVLA